MLGGTRVFPSPLFKGYRASFLGEKWPGYEDDHSPTFDAEVKNE
jgi:hypothetical protein